MKKLWKLIFSIFICHAAGIIGALFTTPNIEPWYNFLNQPSFSPPNWLFGPVWLTLYTLMGISFYLIWQQSKTQPAAQQAGQLFLIHLIFNALWSPIFFGLQQIGLAFAIIIIIEFFIILLFFKFYKISKIAAYLLIPYFLWVSFASILNFSLWILN